MDTTIIVEKGLGGLFSDIPQWLLLSGVVIWFFFTKIYPKIIQTGQSKPVQKVIDKANGEYVLREVCHVHVNEIKGMIGHMEGEVKEVKTEVGKVKDLITERLIR